MKMASSYPGSLISSKACQRGRVTSCLVILPSTHNDSRYKAIWSRCVPGNLQLGYNADKKVLYGVSNITDKWYIVNTSLAKNSSPATPVPGWTSSLDFFDLSDVALTREISTSGPLPVPGPLPLLGAAAAFGWGRKHRRRIVVSSPANHS